MNTHIQVNVGGHQVEAQQQNVGLFCPEVNRKLLDLVTQDFNGVLLQHEKKVKVTLEGNEIIGDPKLGYVLRVIDNGIDIMFPNDVFATVNFSGPMLLKLSEETFIVEKDDIAQDKVETFIKMTLSSKPGNALGLVNSIEIETEGDESIVHLPTVKECREIEVYLTVPQSTHSTQGAYGGITSTDREYFKFNESV